MEGEVRIRTAKGRNIIQFTFPLTVQALRILEGSMQAPFAPHLFGVTPRRFGFSGSVSLSTFYAAVMRHDLSLCYPTDVFQVVRMQGLLAQGLTIHVGMRPRRCPDGIHRILICDEDGGEPALAAVSAGVIDCDAFFLFRAHPENAYYASLELLRGSRT